MTLLASYVFTREVNKPFWFNQNWLKLQQYL